MTHSALECDDGGAIDDVGNIPLVGRQIDCADWLCAFHIVPTAHNLACSDIFSYHRSAALSPYTREGGGGGDKDKNVHQLLHQPLADINHCMYTMFGWLPRPWTKGASFLKSLFLGEGCIEAPCLRSFLEQKWCITWAYGDKKTHAHAHPSLLAPDIRVYTKTNLEKKTEKIRQEKKTNPDQNPNPLVCFSFLFCLTFVHPCAPVYLRGGIVIRTHDVPKNPYTPVFLQIVIGSDYYLRGAILIRTHDVHKNPYIPLFFHTTLGPD